MVACVKNVVALQLIFKHSSWCQIRVKTNVNCVRMPTTLQYYSSSSNVEGVPIKSINVPENKANITTNKNENIIQMGNIITAVEDSVTGDITFQTRTAACFASQLNPEQRSILLQELQQLELQGTKEYSGIVMRERTAWPLRSRFGRPSSVLGKTKIDPIPPTGSQLRQLALFNALPFIGFGFLDNLIMILAGDYIDLTIGATLGITTMAAAALGNTISDLAGICSAWYVENMAGRLGVHNPHLTRDQLTFPSARWSANLGRGFGVTLGCLLGMFPLLFLANHDEDENTSNKHRK